MQVYRHSGAVPPLAVLSSLVAGLVTAVVGGVIYAYFVQWIPLIFLNVLGTLGFGAAVGIAVGIVARVGLLRNSLMVGLIALGCMAVGFWVYWGATLLAMGQPDAGLIDWTPPALIGLVAYLFEHGSWGIKNGDPVSGYFLATVWVVEAATLFWLAWTTARSSIDQPFCERCSRWTETEEGVAKFDANGKETVWQRVITDDLPALGEVPLLHEDKPRFVRVDFARCPQCSESNFLTIQAIEITTNSKGEEKTKETSLIKHGILTVEQAEIIRHLSAMAAEHVAVSPFDHLETETAPGDDRQGEPA